MPENTPTPNDAPTSVPRPTINFKEKLQRLQKIYPETQHEKIFADFPTHRGELGYFDETLFYELPTHRRIIDALVPYLDRILELEDPIVSLLPSQSPLPNGHNGIRLINWGHFRRPAIVSTEAQREAKAAIPGWKLLVVERALDTLPTTIDIEQLKLNEHIDLTAEEVFMLYQLHSCWPATSSHIELLLGENTPGKNTISVIRKNRNDAHGTVFTVSEIKAGTKFGETIILGPTRACVLPRKGLRIEKTEKDGSKNPIIDSITSKVLGDLKNLQSSDSGANKTGAQNELPTLEEALKTRNTQLKKELAAAIQKADAEKTRADYAIKEMLQLQDEVQAAKNREAETKQISEARALHFNDEIAKLQRQLREIRQQLRMAEELRRAAENRAQNAENQAQNAGRSKQRAAPPPVPAAAKKTYFGYSEEDLKALSAAELKKLRKIITAGFHPDKLEKLPNIINVRATAEIAAFNALVDKIQRGK